jgi:hypothetical protein
MADAASPALMQNQIALGRGGDGVSGRFVLAPTVGTRRGQPIELDLPAITARSDLGAAVGAVASAVSDGTLTPEEAARLAQMLDRFPRILAAVPPTEEEVSAEQANKSRHSLIEALDRIAESYSDDEHRAMLEAELAERRARRERLAAKEAVERGVAASPARLDVSVAEDQEQDEDEQQQPADAEPAAIAVARVAITAAAEQQDQQHDEDDKAHGSSPFPARARARASEGLTTG